MFDERTEHSRSLALFPEDRIEAGVVDESVVRLCLSQLRLCRPRVWGSCWLALQLWEALELDRFWRARLPGSRKGTRWDQVLFVLVAYQRGHSIDHGATFFVTRTGTAVTRG